MMHPFAARPLAAAAALALGAVAFPAAAGEPVQRSHDGLTVNGMLELADGSTLADGVILMTHGTLAHNGMEIMTALQERFAERGLNSLAITLSLGVDDRTGMYDCAQPHRHRHEDALAEIGGWVEWLKGQGAGPISLLGHSRGGNQTAWYAAEHTGDPALDGVILVAPMTWSADAARAAYAERAGHPLEELLDQAKAMEPDALVDVPAFLHCGATAASAAAIRSYYGDEPRFDTPALLSGIERPVLVIAGTADETVPDLPARMAAVEAETVRYAEIDGADHFFRDFFADDAADAVEAFLAR